MTDPAIALDLEWRPDFGRGSSRVALVQLASGSRAVLVRVCRMGGGRLPAALRDFLRLTSCLRVLPGASRSRQRPMLTKP